MKAEINLNAQDNYHILKAEALLAGTSALMTAHAQCTCPKTMSNKDLMAKKIITNLSQLVTHEHLTEQFSKVMANLCNMWIAFDARQQSAESADRAAPVVIQNTSLHHAAPVVLQ